MGAASLTGKIPYWGYHLTESRFGTHLVDIRIPVEDMMDTGACSAITLGNPAGRNPCSERIVVAARPRQAEAFRRRRPSSGGVEMYHILGLTPEAPTLDSAFGGVEPVAAIT
jgi:hypothetical protein